MSRFFAALFVCISLSAGAKAQAPEILVRDRVFLVEDKKANNIEFHMLVLAGCGDEANGDCKGIAHYLEHLVLVGRNAQLGDQVVRFFADGGSNGFTNLKMTRYIHNFPAASPDVAERLDKLFAFYSARLKDFSASEADVERERNVVRQEYDVRLGSNAFSPVWQEVNQYLYPRHAIGQMVIGTPNGIAGFNLDEAREYHRKWYHLSNTFFIVSGPVPAEQLKSVADKHLANLERTSAPPREWLAHPPRITAETRTFLKEDSRITESTVNFVRTVNFEERDSLKILAVQTLLNEYLRSKMSGSPHSALVEKAEVAASVITAMIGRPMNGVLFVHLASTPDAETPREQLLEAQKRYLSEFLIQGIDEKILARVKKRFAQTYAQNLANPQTAPTRLIDWLSVPLPYEQLKNTPEVVAGISIEDINNVLSALRGPGREAVVVFAPKADQK